MTRTYDVRWGTRRDVVFGALGPRQAAECVVRSFKKMRNVVIAIIGRDGHYSEFQTEALRVGK